MSGSLSVVATPIGNLGGLSERAAEVLRTADLVLAEDTRRTGRLLAHVGSAAPQRSLHEHNERERAAEVLERIAEGAQVALVTDAGTPLVSDPGLALVRACIEAGVTVIPIPGASAVLAALVVSGLASDRVAFDGFLPRRGRPRSQRIEELRTESRTVVLFVAPHRAAEDLADLAAVLGGRASRGAVPGADEAPRGRASWRARSAAGRGRRRGPWRAHARHRRCAAATASGRTERRGRRDRRCARRWRDLDA